MADFRPDMMGYRPDMGRLMRIWVDGRGEYLTCIPIVDLAKPLFCPSLAPFCPFSPLSYPSLMDARAIRLDSCACCKST